MTEVAADAKRDESANRDAAEDCDSTFMPREKQVAQLLLHLAPLKGMCRPASLQCILAAPFL